MVAKAVFFVCAQALMLQIISVQCCGRLAAPCGARACGGFTPAAAFHGGGLTVTSASAPPSGVSILSENSYCGDLRICGAVPFLGTVGLEGELPTAGSAAVIYSCGHGEVAIVSEDVGAAGMRGIGYGAPVIRRGGCGCGCGGFY